MQVKGCEEPECEESAFKFIMLKLDDGKTFGWWLCKKHAATVLFKIHGAP